MLPSTAKLNPDFSFEPHYLKLMPLIDEDNLNAKSKKIEEVSIDYLNFCINLFSLLCEELNENIVRITES